MTEVQQPGFPAPEPPRPVAEAVEEMRVRAPTRGNRRLERLLEAVNADPQVKAWWHVSAVNATRRLGMSDHSWVHIQIVLNIALRLARLLFRRGVTPSVVEDLGLRERDAEVVIAAACLFHCVDSLPERVAAALRGRGLLVVTTDPAAARARVEAAGLTPALWDNGSPQPSLSTRVGL